MKAIKIAVVMILILNGLYSLFNWLSSDRTPPYQSAGYDPVVTQPQQPEVAAAEGLSLAALTALVKEVRSGEELEKKINQEGSINNMDLNGDSQVDYLFVNEFGEVSKKIGYSLTAEPVKGEVQEVAEVTVEKNGDMAEIQVVGNEQIYGADAVYNDTAPAERRQSVAENREEGAKTTYNNYFYPRPLWLSPWYFGFYPAFFSPFPVVSTTRYVNRVDRYNTSGIKRGRNSYQRTSPTTIRNPDKGKVAKKGITRSLRKPTSTQKQFQAANRQNLKSGGFGKSSRAASGTVTSPRGSTSSFGTSSKSNVNRLGSSQRSGSSSSRSSIFGSTSRSFGSSSFRSRSLGSRSFSFGK